MFITGKNVNFKIENSMDSNTEEPKWKIVFENSLLLIITVPSQDHNNSPQTISNPT